jgi:drug/metabolite transporter (DMT)-like permease
VSQVILKKSSERKYASVISEYLNFRVIFAYGLFFVSTLLTMYAYKGVPLSFGVLLEAMGYIYIPILCYFFLNEKISRLKIVGSIFIILGICFYSIF